MKTLLISLSLFSFSAFAQQFSSTTVCTAKTPCYNYYGQYIGDAQCVAYGSSYVSNGTENNVCTWSAVFNQSVQCAGYVQVQDQWGQLVWAWQNFQVVCPK